MFSLTGTLKVIKDEQKVSDKFKKRDFVLTDSSTQYPQHIMFQMVQDRCGMLDSFDVGDQVKVFFFIRGREWQGKDVGGVKYFNTLDAWKVELANAVHEEKKETKWQERNDVLTDNDSDDLPF